MRNMSVSESCDSQTLKASYPLSGEERRVGFVFKLWIRDRQEIKK